MSSTFNSALVFFGVMVVAILIFAALALWFEHIERLHCPRVVEITKLDVKPGELLVVTVPDDMRKDVRKEMASYIRARLPEGVKGILISQSTRLTKVVASDAGQEWDEWAKNTPFPGPSGLRNAS